MVKFPVLAKVNNGKIKEYQNANEMLSEKNTSIEIIEENYLPDRMWSSIIQTYEGGGYNSYNWKIIIRKNKKIFSMRGNERKSLKEIKQDLSEIKKLLISSLELPNTIINNETW